MADSGIESGFQFDSYKVEKVDFSTDKTLGTLASKEYDYEVKYSFAFRDTFKYTNVASKIAYITGISINVTILSKKDNHEMAKGNFILTGLFYGIGTLSPIQEETLAKTQGPAILFPYARAIISQTLYNAGFAIPIMPLFNINEMAKKMDVKVIEK